MKKVALLFAVLWMGILHATAGEIKTDYRNALIFAYSRANSVYEDDNIKLEIYDEKLWVINKTPKTIFIDLAQCFAFHNGASMPLFDPNAKKQGDEKASKKGISSKDDTYLTIAPAMGLKQNDTYICDLSMRIYGQYSTSETPSNDFTNYDKRLLSLIEGLLNESKGDAKGNEYKGTAIRHLSEDESINNIGASIAYAFNKNTENWTNVSISTWVSDVIFAPYYVEMPKDLSKKDKKGFGIKETDYAYIHIKANTPFEFDQDRSPLIVCDWEGNYKKGTFILDRTWISKKKGVTFWRIFGAVFTSGATLLYSSQNATLYKRRIKFDGTDANWGKMSYVSDIMKTEQESPDADKKKGKK